MRKVNQEIKGRSVIEEILSNSKICRLGMVDNNGLPYILPFNYGYSKNCIYIHSATSGKKNNLLKKNSKVCFEIEGTAEIVKHKTACKWSTLYRSIVGYGDIEIIEDAASKQKALTIIMNHNGASGVQHFEKKQIDSVVILKLKIDSLSAKQSSNWEKLHTSLIQNINSERLLLKEISWNDLEAIHRLHSYPEVDEFNTLGIPKSIDDTKNVIKPLIEAASKSPRPGYTWKIVLKESETFIGLAGMSLSNDKFRLGEIYYKLLPDYWGKGYATEAAKQLVLIGFKDLNLHKVEAGVATKNFRSIRVLEEIGMTREGQRRKILPKNGKWIDNYHYAIVEDDKRDY